MTARITAEIDGADFVIRYPKGAERRHPLDSLAAWLRFYRAQAKRYRHHSYRETAAALADLQVPT